MGSSNWAFYFIFITLVAVCSVLTLTTTATEESVGSSNVHHEPKASILGAGAGTFHGWRPGGSWGGYGGGWGYGGGGYGYGHKRFDGRWGPYLCYPSNCPACHDLSFTLPGRWSPYAHSAAAEVGVDQHKSNNKEAVGDLEDPTTINK